MCSADLAPVDTEFVSKLIGSLGLGDEGNLLSEVEVDLFLAINTLDLDQTNTVVLVAKTALVTEDGSVNMKAWGSGVWHDSKIAIVAQRETDKNQSVTMQCANLRNIVVCSADPYRCYY